MGARDEKAEFGHNLVLDYLRRQGWNFTKWAGEGPHPIDIFCSKKKGKVRALEVKTLSRRTKYADTGISLKHLEDYEHIMAQGQDVWLFFVDHIYRRKGGAAYGGLLADLRAPGYDKENKAHYPKIERGIIYFPLSRMQSYFSLTPEQCRYLADRTRRRSKQKEFPGMDIDHAFLGGHK